SRGRSVSGLTAQLGKRNPLLRGGNLLAFAGDDAVENRFHETRPGTIGLCTAQSGGGRSPAGGKFLSYLQTRNSHRGLVGRIQDRVLGICRRRGRRGGGHCGAFRPSAALAAARTFTSRLEDRSSGHPAIR